MAVTYPKGFQAAGVVAGIKKSGAKDVALLVAAGGHLNAAMVGTTNQVCAPSVKRNRTLTPGQVSGVVINSGCANVATGPEGVANNEAMGAAIDGHSLLTASTGVIGVQLPQEKLLAGIRAAHEALSESGGDDFAEAILTTDLVKKTAQAEVTLGGTSVRIGGACKGSGMIEPNMATMLAFVTTDLSATPEVLDAALKSAVNVSFNCLTVDGDTSTSDQVILLSSGAADNTTLTEPSGVDYESFVGALTEVCISLARQVARDGEGATKLVTVTVTGAHNNGDAQTVARSIANSPLVKTALFGNDPNWGRLMMAAGKAGIPFDPDNASATLAGFSVFEQGVPTNYDRAAASEAMKAEEVAVSVALGLGGWGKATVYTCDFSYDYVKINAEYTT
ncbi:MAG: bifunctional glutamate N-acetyltransferase/amino-acid acetyltransferase ArgJ [Armatimonas sp.]